MAKSIERILLTYYYLSRRVVVILLDLLSETKICIIVKDVADGRDPCSAP